MGMKTEDMNPLWQKPVEVIDARGRVLNRGVIVGFSRDTPLRYDVQIEGSRERIFNVVAKNLRGL